MEKLCQFPTEISVKILKYIPLKEIYDFICSSSLFLDPYICIIVDDDKCRNYGFIKSFKNVINVKDFKKHINDHANELIQFYVIHISRTKVSDKGYRKLTNTYKILKNMNKHTIMITEYIKELGNFTLNYDARTLFTYYPQEVLENYTKLVGPYQQNNLLILKNIPLYLHLPWEIELDEWTSDHGTFNKQYLEYVFNNLIIEEVQKRVIFDDGKIRENQSSALVYIDTRNQHLDEALILKNIKDISIHLSKNMFNMELHKRVFDIINYNVETIKELSLYGCPSNKFEDSIFRQLSSFVPHIYNNIKTLDILFDNGIELSDLSFPNLEILTIYYGNLSMNELNIPNSSIDNISLPKLKKLDIGYKNHKDFKYTIYHSRVLVFGAEYEFRNFDSYGIVIGSSEYFSNGFNREVDIKDLLRQGLKFDLMKRTKRLVLNETKAVKAFNEMEEVKNFNFENLEQLLIRLLLHSTDQDNSQYGFVNEFFTNYTRFFTNLRKLELDIRPSVNCGYLIFPTLVQNTLPALEDLSLKGTWNNLAPIGLTEMALLKLDFITLKFLRLDHLIFTQFSIVDLPNLEELSLCDVFADQLMTELSIVGQMPKLELLRLEYTDRKKILTELASEEFYKKMETTLDSVEDWCDSKPNISIDHKLVRNLSYFKFSKKFVNIKVINKRLRSEKY